jgi:hypothetical protein
VLYSSLQLSHCAFRHVRCFPARFIHGFLIIVVYASLLDILPISVWLVGTATCYMLISFYLTSHMRKCYKHPDKQCGPCKRLSLRHKTNDSSRLTSCNLLRRFLWSMNIVNLLCEYRDLCSVHRFCMRNFSTAVRSLGTTPEISWYILIGSYVDCA